ncbi:4-hydroxy-tetrahydrodipicolinate synthase [Lactobacillus sp. LC28-10]|uniref:4-hydroxy-tetrahydrodipicolinate synthase n=1 Tax=Secundilactobacillus angelensis TaxID=2722706 RepID=A0ABX1KZ50_9LACO|nr:4-hydroxy-tetrahydrodipicolinate synthase [Secundilactobacillus angelensis]MCH5462435.1 4-hydroxy-tetrahydrodipicolinate synthase [Secundilactobacillus angelensis]NLR18083.1 4-hydroxy-tetrahydrodipicolinate synthase [Secundilactobacillus angelensis]
MTTLENVDLMTAIITPFDENDNINYQALEKLTNHLIDTGSKGFVIGGTTGETPTLTHDEKIDLYTRFGQIIGGRVPVIAGTGSNNTRETAALTKEVSEIQGVDYELVVVPYYNKPSQRGMIAHFTAVADAAEKPIIIYNIPGRTGVTMANETVVTLSQNPKIAGVKQCTSIDDIEFLVEHTPDDFYVYSGEDAQALSARVVGGAGVISVASHIYGDQMRSMYDALYAGDLVKAGGLKRQLTPKMAALFMFPSPSPVKAVLNAQGYGVGDCRLPIQSLNDDESRQLAHALGMDEGALVK